MISHGPEKRQLTGLIEIQGSSGFSGDGLR
jgi:hypothetical protein